MSRHARTVGHVAEDTLLALVLQCLPLHFCLQYLHIGHGIAPPGGGGGRRAHTQAFSNLVVAALTDKMAAKKLLQQLGCSLQT